MKRILLKLFTVLLLLFISIYSNAQRIAINSSGMEADTSAMLDIASTTTGFLVPRMLQSQRTAIVLPATGLLVYQTDNISGFYYYNGTIWQLLTSSAGSGWGITGNSNTTSTTNFIGTTNAYDVVFKTNGSENMRLANVTGNLVLGSGDGTGTVTGNTLRAPNGSGTNIAGANLTITPGDGTGTGGSGNLIFQTASVGSTGSIVNSMTERLRITTTGAIAVAGASNYGTSGNVFQSGGNGAPTWNPITLSNTNSVTGTLAVGNGGIGATTLTSNGIIYGNGTSAVGVTAAGTMGELLTANSSGVPTWMAAGTNGYVLTFNSGVPTWEAPGSSTGWALTGNGGISNPSVPSTYGVSTINGNWIGTTGGQDVVFGTNSIERMRVCQTTGNVGIGTATPSGTLDVEGGTPQSAGAGTNITLDAQSGNGNAAGGNIVLTAGNTGTSANNVNAGNVNITAGSGGTGSTIGNGGNIIMSSGIGVGGGSTNGYVSIKTAPASSLTEAVRITNAGILILGSGEATGTVSGNTLRAPNASGNNIAGANLTIMPGNGTGSGGSGNIIFQTAPSGSSGSTANTMATVMQITSSGSIGIGNSTPASDAGIAIKNAHYESQQTTAPVAAVGSGAGTGMGANTPSASLTTATDVGGTLTFKTGSTIGSAASPQATVTFNKAYTTTPIIVITPIDATTGAAAIVDGPYVVATTTGFSFYFSTAPATKTTYNFNYMVLETQ